jgi:hypothetical protein
MGHSQDILAAQRALVEDDDLRDELGLDDDEAVTACPDCESASIEYHAGTAFGGEPASAPWTCQDCGEAFEAPIERSPERESGSCRHGPAKSLVDADPDDIRTDGGVDLDELIAKRYEAEQFWAQYDIPFEHDTCIKVRRSGLLRGSSGTGHAADTVVHLHVKEPFNAGRLTRSEDAYLCEKGSTVDFQGREERHCDGDGGSYRPKVTCETCLQRMERWQVDEKEIVTDGGVRYEPTDAEHQAGTVVVDLASGQALQVVSVATQPAGEHPQTRSDPTAEMFDSDADEPVYNCVFLPDGEKVSPPSKTYAYPESRLLRYPVERATDGVDLQTHLRAAMLTQLCEAADQSQLRALVDLAEAAFGDDVAELLAQEVDA